MTESPNITEQEVELQRPDLGIETVEAADPINVPESTLTWVKGGAELQAVKVTLETGQSFLYASAIGQHNTLRKLADRVPDSRQNDAEAGLFKALPQILNHESTPNIDTVAFAESDSTILKTVKNGKNVARLAFTVTEIDGKVCVIKVGLANHDKQNQMANVMRGTGKKVRRKQDGGRR